MFLLKMVCKDKNIIKNTKSQLKKTVREIVNFGSTNWTKHPPPQKNLETQHNGTTFL